MLSIIDQDVTRAQFAAFPPDISSRLLAACEADIVNWSDQLLAAWGSADREAINRARHALKGLCGNFGATKLLDMAGNDLSAVDDRVALLKLREATIHSIRMIALGISVP